jgi:hypothetical protein
LCFETDLGLIFLIEFFSDGSDLPMFEFRDFDRAPSLGGSDQRTEHQLQDGSLAERIRDDFEATAFLDKGERCFGTLWA